MKVIPAIDLLEGQVVRLKKGSYQDVTVYHDDPLEEAQKFEQAGFSYIHVVDLDGARDGTSSNLKDIIKIKNHTKLTIQAGGGIRSYEDAEKLLNCGINRLICSSLAVKNREDWMRLLQDYPDRMILGMDLKDGQLAYGGWQETSDESIISFLRPMIQAGLRYVLCTDIARDGMLQGANVELYRTLQHQFSAPHFIASGGVASADDLEQLAEAGLYGVVVGRAYYENRLSLDEMQNYHS